MWGLENQSPSSPVASRGDEERVIVRNPKQHSIEMCRGPGGKEIFRMLSNFAVAIAVGGGGAEGDNNTVPTDATSSNGWEDSGRREPPHDRQYFAEGET